MFNPAPAQAVAEPLNARHWQEVRKDCCRRRGRTECLYPWCHCTPVVPIAKPEERP